MSITASYCLPDKTKGSFTHSFEWFVVFFKLAVTGSRILEVHSRAQRSSLTALTNPLILEINKRKSVKLQKRKKITVFVLLKSHNELNLVLLQTFPGLAPDWL